MPRTIRSFYFINTIPENESDHNSKNYSEGNVFDITEDLTTGELIIGTQYPGLWTLDTINNLIVKYKLQENIFETNEISVTNFYRNENGIIWIGTSTGLTRLDPSRQLISFYPHSQISVYKNDSDFNPVLEDRYGIVWKGDYGNGLLLFNPQTKKYNEYKYDKFNTSSLYGNYVISFYEDKSGIIWLGKQWWGLDKCDRKKIRFKQISHNPRDPNSLSGNDVYSICEDSDGLIWLGIITM